MQSFEKRQKLEKHPMYSHGLALHKAGRVSEALRIYGELLHHFPNHPRLHFLLGVAEAQLGKFLVAIEHLKKSYDLDSTSPETCYNLGNIYGEIGDDTEAIRCYESAIALEKKYYLAYNNLGNAFRRINQLNKALDAYNCLIVVNPKFAEGYFNRGVVLQETGFFSDALNDYQLAIENGLRTDFLYSSIGAALFELKFYEKAIKAYDLALTLNSTDAVAYNNKANACQLLERYEEAIALYDQAITLKADYAEAYFNKASTYQKLALYAEALETYDFAITINPEYAEAYNNKGNIYQLLERYEEAIQLYHAAINCNSTYAKPHFNLGVSYQEIGQLQKALEAYNGAIQLDPNSAETYSNKGVALFKMHSFAEAFGAYNKALELNAKYAEVYNNRGILNFECGDLESALKDFDVAIDMRQDYVEPYTHGAFVLSKLGKFEEAKATLVRAQSIDPKHDFLLGELMLTRMALNDWEHYYDDCSHLIEGIRSGNKVSVPFPTHAYTDNPEVQLKCAQIYLADSYFGVTRELIFKPKLDSSRINIGYFSPDFGDHPVSYLLAELFERHDRSKFEISAFSFGPVRSGDWRDRIKTGVDHFYDVASMSDYEISVLARTAGIDIAVDLSGYTENCRPGIFYERAAPIQIGYIGFLGTTGAPYMDYIIADKVLIPNNLKRYYSEKIIYLPCYQCNDSRKSPSDIEVTKRKFELPENGFIFCSFNNNFKITPEVFDSWMRILISVPNSVLWLYVGVEQAKKNILLSAKQNNIDSLRIIFAEKLPLPEHLARLHLADLFLDTYPYNAGATASGALKMGLPLLTRFGPSFSSRVGASLLTSLDLRELIASSMEDYERIAINLAHSPEALTGIKKKLQVALRDSPLFSAKMFAHNIELAYEEVYGRYTNKLPLDDVFV